MLNRAHNKVLFKSLATLYLAGWSLIVQAQDLVEPPAALLPTSTAFKLTREILTLPDSEKMGLLGSMLLFDVNHSLRLGAGSFGAVRGSRGGFITLGVAAELRHRLSSSWVSHAGLYVGAGGGRGTNILTGGGLMLRSDINVSHETHRYGNFGFGFSRINFPSGLIRSSQPYVLYEYPFYSLLGQGWYAPPFASDSAWQNSTALDANEFALVWRSYKISSSMKQAPSNSPHKSMQLLGVEWLSYLNEHWFYKLEAEGAIGSKSNGYMQILGGGGYRYALSPWSAIKLHIAAGPAGGGGIDTGGGLLLDTGISLQQSLARQSSIEMSLGEVRSPSATFKALSAGLKLNYQFDLPRVSALPVSKNTIQLFEPQHLRVRLANQTYLKANTHWRNNEIDSPISNLGVQMDYFISPQWYLTGQGLAAYAGKAGDYMTGQVGVGRQWSLSSNCFVEVEGLLGAAGGGGVAINGGLVGQVNGSVAYRLNNWLSLMAHIGQIKALPGQFKANVVGVSLAYQFSGFTSSSNNKF